jgi:hypothetical protein
MSFFRLYRTLIVLTGLGFIAAVFYIFARGFSISIDPKVWIKNQLQFGEKNAKVEVWVFEDLHCEECKEFTLHIYPLLKKNYIDTGKIKYFFIPLELLANSEKIVAKAFCLFQQNPALAEEFLRHHFFSLDKNEKSEEDSVILSPCYKAFNPQDFLQKNLRTATHVMEGNVEVPIIFVQGKKLKDVGYFTISKEIEKALAE